jgi:muconolactone delta-isomerase
MEYLVTMTTLVPDGTTDRVVDEIRSREAARSRELATQGYLLRLWRPPLQPGEWRTLGLFSAADSVELEDVLASMPLRVWLSDQVVPLSEGGFQWSLQRVVSLVPVTQGPAK